MNSLDTIISSAKYVYSCLGTGHSEIVYHKAMEVELREINKLMYESKVVVPIHHRGLTIGYSEADLIVYEPENTEQGIQGIVVELKAVTYAPREAEFAQVRSYLRSRGAHRDAFGLLINFRQPTATNKNPTTIDWAIVRLDEGINVFVTSSEKDPESNDNE